MPPAFPTWYHLVWLVLPLSVCTLFALVYAVTRDPELMHLASLFAGVAIGSLKSPPWTANGPR